MPRHGTPEQMRDLVKGLQASGHMPPGLPVTVGCVVDSVPYPLRVVWRRHADKQGRDITNVAWLNSQFWGTVLKVDKSVVYVLWDVGGGEQLCTAEQLLLIHRPRNGRAKVYYTGSRWWEGVDNEVLEADRRRRLAASHDCQLGADPSAEGAGAWRCPTCEARWRYVAEPHGPGEKKGWVRHGVSTAG